jgi:hypothetical protein
MLGFKVSFLNFWVGVGVRFLFLECGDWGRFFILRFCVSDII